MDALVQRLVQNPHDAEAITYAHQAGQSDPRSYAMLLERVGRTTEDPVFACHWLTEAANVWSTTLGDAHRAARALMTAIDRDPTQPAPAEKLAELYREKGDNKALVALLERRAKALAPLTQDPAMASYVASLHEELASLWGAPPLSQAKKAIENYRRAIELEPGSQYAIYALRELYKSQQQWLEAIPLFASEQALTTDPARQIALYQDEAEARKLAGDGAGASLTLRHAWAVDQGRDPAIRLAYATSILERAQAGQPVPDEERAEAAALFNQLAEEYGGEYGLTYSMCAAEVDPRDDRGIQLAMFYSAQEGREAEVLPLAARYLSANPQGAMAADAQAFVGTADIAQLAAQASAKSSPSAAVGLGGGAATDVSARNSAEPAHEEQELTEEVSGVFEEFEPISEEPALAADPDRVAALRDEAELLARKGRKTEAGAKYRELVQLEPGNEEALNFLQTHLRQTRKYADLRDVLTAATRVSGASQEAKRGWLREIAGLCESQLKDPEGAIHALQQLIALDSSEAPRAQLKRILERAGRFDDLATLLEQEAEQASDLEVRISLEKNLAKLHETKRQDFLAAGDVWSRIANLTPEDESALLTAVQFYEKGERADLAADAIAANVSSVEDEAAKSELLSRLGELRQQAGDALAAGDAFAEAAALSQKVGLWARAEENFVQAEAWDQAAQAVDEQAQLTSEPRLQAQLYAREASHLLQAGDESSALLRLEQATDIDPTNQEFADAIEQRFTEAERFEDLTAFLLRRADRLEDRAQRMLLRRRAAKLQREVLGELDAARETLQQLLQDGDDYDALIFLVEDAEERGEPGEAVEYLARIKRVVEQPELRLEVLLREARLFADALKDVDAALERYREVLATEPNNWEALSRVADLEQDRGQFAQAAQALEAQLAVAEEAEVKLEIAQRLADLYETELEDLPGAVRSLESVLKLDEEDFSAIERLVGLNERLENWSQVAVHLRQLIEVEGDDDELAQMNLRLAKILHEKCEQGDEALAILVEAADNGHTESRDAYVQLGDALGWKGVVATKLVEWHAASPAGLLRNQALRDAFERFVEVGRHQDAAQVAKELVRSKAADVELARALEGLGVELKDLDAIGIAHDLLGSDLTGSVRTEELVRQAEVLKQAGVSAADAIQHAEQGLVSVSAEETEALLGRLAELAEEPAQVIDLYERQVSRAKAAPERLQALARAAQVAAERGALDRARGYFELALGGSIQEENLTALEEVAKQADEATESEGLRRLLAAALANGGQGSRDGGRTRAALLRRAARLIHEELGDVEQAFKWLKEALVAQVDDSTLDALEALADAVGEPSRVEAVLTAALEEVFDGPLVRKLLARRAALRRDKLQDVHGAAADLKRLHDLSPGDQQVMDQLLALYKQLEDYRGMVQLYEDQILRGKDPNSRAELARKVARLWEERLADPREAADAWRRVLRMKKEDPEATEGLERAKKGMLKAKSSPPPALASIAPKKPASIAPPAAAVAAASTLSAGNLATADESEAAVEEPASASLSAIASDEEGGAVRSSRGASLDEPADVVSQAALAEAELSGGFEPEPSQDTVVEQALVPPSPDALGYSPADLLDLREDDDVTLVGDVPSAIRASMPDSLREKLQEATELEEPGDEPPTLPPASSELAALEQAEEQIQSMRGQDLVPSMALERPDISFAPEDEVTMSAQLEFLEGEAGDANLSQASELGAEAEHGAEVEEILELEEDDELLLDENALLGEDDEPL